MGSVQMCNTQVDIHHRIECETKCECDTNKRQEQQYRGTATGTGTGTCDTDMTGSSVECLFVFEVFIPATQSMEG